MSMSLAGCYEYECGKYADLIEDPGRNEILSSWSDSEFFSKNFIKSDLNIGRLVGPGRSGAFSNIHYPLDDFGQISDLEFRPLGKDPLNPNAVFIGVSSFRGLIVARTSLPEDLKASGISMDAIEVKKGRIGMICHRER
jgi:hypothetical protein